MTDDTGLRVRVERLERDLSTLRRSTARWRGAFLLLASSCGALLLLGAAARPAAIRARALTVEGPHPGEKVYVGSRDGLFGIFVTDGDRISSRAALVVQSGGTSALLLRAPDGGHGVIAQVEADGTASVVTRHDEAESGISVDAAGRAGLRLGDRHGEDRAFAVLSTNGTPSFELDYPGANAGFYGTVDADGARIAFSSPKGSGFTTGVTIDGEEASEDLTPGGEGD